MATTYSISGSAGTSGATVTAGTSSATSDASNNFTIASLAAGTYTVTPTKTGCTFSPASQSVTISSANVTGVNFTASCPSGDLQLTSGVAVTGQSVAKSAWKYYYIVVPSGATNLTLATTSATGDVDIYTQSGAKPTSSSYVCRPYSSSGNETCSATNPAAATWWLGVYGYAAGSYTVTGTYTLGGTTYTVSGNAGTASATITAGTKTATSDASSNFTITGLANGTYTVTPTKSGCTFTPATRSVTVASANVTGVTFTATCGGATTLFTDGFETTGWSIVDTSGTAGNWTFPASGTHPSVSPHGGAKLAIFNSYTSSSGSQTRVYRTAGFAVASSYTSVSLKFWMYHDTGYSSYNDRVQAAGLHEREHLDERGHGRLALRRHGRLDAGDDRPVRLQGPDGLPRVPRHQRLRQRLPHRRRDGVGPVGRLPTLSPSTRGASGRPAFSFERRGRVPGRRDSEPWSPVVR